MSNLYLCKRCRNDYAVWPEDLCEQCRAELVEIDYDSAWATDDVPFDVPIEKYPGEFEPPVDPDDTADIQMLFDEDENDGN